MATWDDKFHNTNQIPIFFKYNKLKCGVRSYSIFYVINLAQCVKGNVSPLGPGRINVTNNQKIIKTPRKWTFQNGI